MVIQAQNVDMVDQTFTCDDYHNTKSLIGSVSLRNIQTNIKHYVCAECKIKYNIRKPN